MKFFCKFSPRPNSLMWCFCGTVQSIWLAGCSSGKQDGMRSLFLCLTRENFSQPRVIFSGRVFRNVSFFKLCGRWRPRFADALLSFSFCRAAERPCGSDSLSGKRGCGPGEKPPPAVAPAGLLLQLGLPWQQLRLCKQWCGKGLYVQAHCYIVTMSLLRHRQKFA